MNRVFELALPLASVGALRLYFRPDLVPTVHAADDVGVTLVAWLVWALIATAIGVLGVSAACLVFCLLYSPLYLLSYLRKRWSFRRRRWVDTQEVRFYRYCFALLCLLGAAAILNPTTALVAFVVLAGSAPLLWRVIL